MSSNSRYEPFLRSTKENNKENVNDKTTDTTEYQSKLKETSEDAASISKTPLSYAETNINEKTEDSREIETVWKDEDSKLLDSSIESFHSYLYALEEDNGAKYANLLSNVPFLELKNAQDNKEIIHREKGYHAIAAFLLKFLRAGEGDCEVASEILINYILLMRDHPQYYSSSLLPDDIQRVFDEKIHTVLPFRDKYGRRVFVWRPGRWNPASINFTDCYCAMYMLCEMIALEPETQINGCTVVCDGGGIGFKQLSSMGIEDIRNCANFIQVHIVYCILWVYQKNFLHLWMENI